MKSINIDDFKNAFTILNFKVFSTLSSVRSTILSSTFDFFSFKIDYTYIDILNEEIREKNILTSNERIFVNKKLIIVVIKIDNNKFSKLF